MVFRSRRLEGILGAPADALGVEHLSGLVEGAVEERFDLEFKERHYGNSDGEKRDLATDVAAMANTAGGLILIGIQEDDHARASALTPVEISDSVRGRIRQIVSSGVSPMPTFDVHLIPGDASDSTHGFVIIAVPRSRMAPHAVLVNDGLRYPRRNGPTIRYLSEAEVAGAYRDRTASAAERLERLENVEADVLSRLASDQLWVVVTLVPELPGSMDINAHAIQAVRQEFSGRYITPFERWLYPHTARAGRERIVITLEESGTDVERVGVTELHTDGAGCWALALYDIGDDRTRRRQAELSGEPEDRHAMVSDEGVAEATIAAALILGEHASQRAGADGTGLLRLRIFWSPGELPKRIGIGNHRGEFGASYNHGSRLLTIPPAPADTTGALDEIASGGPDLLAILEAPLRVLAQSFGVAEVLQIDAAGQLRGNNWNRTRLPEVRQWADDNAIHVVPT